MRIKFLVLAIIVAQVAVVAGYELHFFQLRRLGRDADEAIAAATVERVGLMRADRALSDASRAIALHTWSKSSRSDHIDWSDELRSVIADHEDEFTSLEWERVTVIGPPSHNYNCIAWSLGLTSYWIWPSDSLHIYEMLFESLGFSEVEVDDAKAFALERGFEKIVLYVEHHEEYAPVVQVRHAAVLGQDGRWTTKMGSNALLVIESPQVLEGSYFGKIERIYKRPVL